MVSSPALPSLVWLTQYSRQQGVRPFYHTLGSDSPALIPPAPALLFCPGKFQGLLSGLMLLVRVRTSSSILLSPRHPLTSEVSDKGWRGYFSNPSYLMAYKGGSGTALLLSYPQSQLTCNPPNPNRVSYSVLPR